ncbi:hypothetical protein IPJ72_07280 [Candidatus Peregrinibacteria bacterium]|nr:MAG: hypothetical protein IPJ72_07280 [Candidatus Peregrinibacteria bacterium]
MKRSPFTLQLMIIGGLMVVLYLFFSLTTLLYRDYKIDQNIKSFEQEIDHLAQLAYQKPKDVQYFESTQFRDLYAKESLNLLNPGEKLIIIPRETSVVKNEPAKNTLQETSITQLPLHYQWWEYFFGATLSIKTQTIPTQPPTLNERIESSEKIDS